MIKNPLRRSFLKLFNLWPPFLGSGISLKRLSADYRYAEVEVPLRFYNRNYVGTHFGGILFMISDAFYVIMLIENLGKNFIVWDKEATIRYIKPGKTRIKATFELSQERIDEILRNLQTQDKYETVFRVDIKDINNQVIAEVDRLLYIRKKKLPVGETLK